MSKKTKKLLVWSAIIIGLLTILSSPSNDSVNEDSTEGYETIVQEEFSSTEETTSVVPSFSIKEHVYIRYDGAPNMYILAEDLEASNSIKENIKLIVDEVAKDEGTNKLSISIFNTQEALDAYFNAEDKTEALSPAEIDLHKKSYVAFFEGENDTWGDDSISMYPSTFTSDVNVGEYVETFDYTPNL